MRKAQVSMEVLLIIGFALAALLPILLTMRTEADYIAQRQGVLEADQAAQRIAENANIVASIGNNATVETEVILPGSVQSIKIGQTSPREIVLVVSTVNGPEEIVKNTNANLTGTLDIRGGGTYYIKISSVSTTTPIVKLEII